MANPPSLTELRAQGLLDDEADTPSLADLDAQGLLDGGGANQSVRPIDPASWQFPAGMEWRDPAADPATVERHMHPPTLMELERDGLLDAKEAVQGALKPAANLAVRMLSYHGQGAEAERMERALASSALSSYGADVHGQDVDALGSAAKYAMPIADMVGQAPMYAMLPEGKATTLLGKAGQATLVGAGTGALSGALTRDGDITGSMLGGAVMGAGASLLGAGAKAALGKLAPKAAEPVLIPRPTINESVLQAQLRRDALMAAERARGIEIDPEAALSYAERAAQDTTGRAGGPPPQNFQAYLDYEKSVAERGTVADTPVAKTLIASPTQVTPAPTASPQGVAAATNAATPPPPPNVAPVVMPPVPTPLPGTLPAQQVQNFADITATVNRVRFAKTPIMQRIRDFLESPGVRGEPGVRHIANEAKVAKSLTKMSEDTLASVDKGLGKYRNDLTFRRALSDLADGKIDIAKISADHPEAWIQAQKIIGPTLDEIAQNDQVLRAMGYVPQAPSWMADPEISKYAARAYLSKTAPKGAWGRVAPQEVVDNGIDYILNQAQAVGTNVKDPAVRQQIANDVLDMLNSGKTWEDIVGSPEAAAWTKPFKNLKGREQLPKPIRALLGEIEDGPYRMAHTIGTQRSLIATLSVAREVALNPAYTANGPLVGPTGKWVQMPNMPSMGPLAGKWVRPDIAEAMGNAAHVAPRVSQVGSRLMHFFKANVTVFGGVPAWTHEFIGNLDNSMLSGGFDITRPLATGKAFMRADSALRAYFKNPSSPEAAEMLEVFRLGAADMGWSRAEMRQANQNMIAIMDRELRRQKGQSIWNVMDALPKIMQAGQKVYAKSGQAWDMVSLHMRTASYFNLRDKFILQGMAPDAARRQAAQRVIMSFPSPHNLSAGVEDLRNSAFGFVAPFTTYLAEDARIRLQIPQRVMEGEHDLPVRMAIHYGILGGALAAAGTYGMQKYGISKEELEAANTEVTRGQSYYRPMQWAIPIRDDKGRITVTDFTWLNPAFRLPQGDIVDPLWKRLATNTLLYPFEGGAAEEPIRKLAQAAGGAQMPPQYTLRPGEAGLTVFLQQLNRSGLGGPSAISRIQSLARQAGQTENTSPFQEVLTPGEVASNIAGFPTRAVTVPTDGQASKSVAARGVELERSMRDLTTALRQAVASGDPERVTRVRAMIDATIADFKNMQTKIEAAKAAKGQ